MGAWGDAIIDARQFLRLSTQCNGNRCLEKISVRSNVKCSKHLLRSPVIKMRKHN